jgi:TPR repeat protein
MAKRLAIVVLAGLAAFAAPFPAQADVKAGVDAWSRGDWNTAVAEWRAPAEAGDVDALFNMGQAYRLGRGVPQDQTTAEAYYLRAAQKGHIRAADTYGLLLFQDGRREAALPFVEDAANRGDPRAQYLIGIAHFNGDIVGKDWVRAYALVTLANSQGLPQAAPALAEMDQHIPLEQRQQAASLAINLQQQADATRAREMASADLALGGSPVQEAPVQASTPAAQPFTPGLRPAPVQNATPRVPQPVASAQIAPSTALGQPVPSDPEREPAVLAARRAVREAMEATGTEDPGEAGADYARPSSTTRPVSGPARPTAQAAAPARTPPDPAPARASSSGPWKLQLGAFSVRGNAEALSSRLRGRQDLAGKDFQLVPTGRLTRLLVGGYATRAEAQAACNALERSGQACIVTR